MKESTIIKELSFNHPVLFLFSMLPINKMLIIARRGIARNGGNLFSVNSCVTCIVLNKKQE